jgi:hypothetical protein
MYCTYSNVIFCIGGFSGGVSRFAYPLKASTPSEKLRIFVLKFLLFMVGMDLLGGGGVHPPSPGQRGCRGGAIFHDKAKNIRDKMRYSNLSDKMMISKL